MANLARYDDLNTGAIAYASLVSCILLVVIILCMRALTCAWIESGEAAQTANAHYVSADSEISEQKARLAGYEIQKIETIPTAEDGTTGEPIVSERFQIPLSRAKELVIDELNSAGASQQPGA